uniref:Uncharacterized protein n=1 Tax=Anguilla anguilla TaxID=7936 RepID=A0A0E9V799_ANGAN
MERAKSIPAPIRAV